MNWLVPAIRERLRAIAFAVVALFAATGSLLPVTLVAENPRAVTKDSAGPTIDVWYGADQVFGRLGQPQRWVNILGRVSDSDGLAALSYRLNGGAWQPLNIGPNYRRLEALGDFNAEIAIDDLLAGANLVELHAKDDLGNVTTSSVTVHYDGLTDWPLPFQTDWTEPGVVEDYAQVVDGLWVLDSGASVVEWGYDRLLAIGDLSWTDYEVTAEFTVHAIQDVCLQGDTCSGGPAVGMIVRWPGHYAWDDSQPRRGWHPMGAMGLFFYYRDDVPNGKLEFFDSDGNADRIPSLSLPLSTPYVMKMRAETVPDVGHEYRLKLWAKSDSEPEAWQFVDQQPLSAHGAGSVLLIVHHVDATIGPVSIIPLNSEAPDTQAPTAPTDLTATAASSASIDLAWTASSDDVGVAGYTVYRDGVAVTTTTMPGYSDSGLAAATTYRYTVDAFDAAGNASALSASAEATTEPASSSSSGLVSDDFGGSGLDTAVWTWRDPRGDSSLGLSNGRLTIDVPGGVRHDIWSTDNNAPRLMQASDDTDFDVVVKFDSVLDQAFELQGLVAEESADDFVRFDFHSRGSETRVFAATFVGGSPSKRVNLTIPDGMPLWLRVERAGDVWTQSYSYDGASWQTAGEFTHALALSGVGVFAGNSGDPVPAFAGVLDDFRVLSDTADSSDTQAPSTPTDLSATATSSASIDLAWAASSDNVGVAGYTVYRDGVAVTTTSAPGYSDTGLAAETAYSYTVDAFDAAGNASAQSASAGATTPAEPSSSSGLVSDDFSASALDAAVWTLRDPRGDSNVGLSDGRLTIDVPGGVRHDIWSTDNNAPRLVQTSDDTDFDVVVKFDSVLDQAFELQGLVAEESAGDFVRFDLHSRGSETRVFTATFVGGSPTKRVNLTIPDGTPLWLRVERAGDVWTQSYSYDGVSWQTAGEFTHALALSGVGVFAGNSGDPVPAFAGVLDDFRVLP